jgi:ribosomal protein S18 acetylase RimI-like enzyme
VTPVLEAGYELRPTRCRDVARLQAVERDAAALYLDFGFSGPAFESVRSEDEHRAAAHAGTAWLVARDGEPCGFALCSLVDGQLHLLELSVARSHQRRGLGTALLLQAIEHARARGDAAVTLTTFRDVPWNAPFYRRHGFVELDTGRLSPELARIVGEEAAEGLDPSLRCAMARPL